MLQTDALILIVDDTEDIRDIWRRVLCNAGFRVVEAVDGEDGVRKTRELLPNLVVMDMSMPLLCGIEASRRLKTDSLTAAIPIIIVSADDDTKAEACAVGCEAFLLKPVRHPELIGHIRRLLTSTAITPAPVRSGEVASGAAPTKDASRRNATAPAGQLLPVASA
jgi:CheY-like chemotaxis protein